MNRLVAAEQVFAQRAEDAAVTSLMQDDARNSIQVLHSLQRMSNQLGQHSFSEAPQRQAKLILSGVEISAQADLLVTGRIRNTQYSGAAILRLTQDDADTEPARGRRREMGLYVATIARMQAEQNLDCPNTIANRLCMSIDIQHGEVFTAPDSNVRRMSDLENACRFIASMWDGI